MDSCIQSISPTYEQTEVLQFKTDLQVKKVLLNDQLAALQMPNYEAEDIFILNKTYKLEDET